ncbi:MAG TPA: phytanoyl-CoA dioxygenase family protein [Puia sp.]|nr:phytanoyl-CoA dioxygenase family protein [Puia sp.]
MAVLDTLKQLRMVHWLYNLVHYKSLLHNKAAYKKYNIRKTLAASISSKDFPDKESKAWLDIAHSKNLVFTKEKFKEFPAEVQEQLLNWSDNGYIILSRFFDEPIIEPINQEIERLIRQKKIEPTYFNKLRFANKISPPIKKFTFDRRLTDILSFILDKEVVPFQTLNFIYGSGQRAHSDSIHMTTYPLGYLIAAWIALEDMNMDNGPLFYYPGSHRMPFLLNNGLNNAGNAISIGKKDYTGYEDLTEKLVIEKNFEKKIFLAKKGDVLIWHANLVHGGLPVANPELTRKSMVIHYYAKDVIKYHEISERPSLIED